MNYKYSTFVRADTTTIPQLSELYGLRDGRSNFYFDGLALFADAEAKYLDLRAENHSLLMHMSFILSFFTLVQPI